MAETTLQPPPGHGLLSQLTSEDGDLPITWDPADPESVADARQAFNDLRAKGWSAYTVEGEDRQTIRRFPDRATRIIMHRPLRGG
jgi:hypothetical protein